MLSQLYPKGPIFTLCWDLLQMTKIFPLPLLGLPYDTTNKGVAWTEVASNPAEEQEGLGPRRDHHWTLRLYVSLLSHFSREETGSLRFCKDHNGTSKSNGVWVTLLFHGLQQSQSDFQSTLFMHRWLNRQTWLWQKVPSYTAPSTAHDQSKMKWGGQNSNPHTLNSLWKQGTHSTSPIPTWSAAKQKPCTQPTAIHMPSEFSTGTNWGRSPSHQLLCSASG